MNLQFNKPAPKKEVKKEAKETAESEKKAPAKPQEEVEKVALLKKKKFPMI